MKFRKIFGIFLCFCLFSGCSKTKGNKVSGDNNSPKQTKNYVASTSWVASIAWIAGLENVQIIAPMNLKHPPEYEITPDDVLKISEADLFMYAGYERMMKTLSESVGVREERQVKVTTTNSLENITEMVKMLSMKAGTEEVAEKRLKSFTDEIEKMKKDVQAWGGNRSVTLNEIRFYVNTNQVPLAKEFGLNVAGTFGPGPLTAEQIADVADKNYDVIIDNVHNPVAGPAVEYVGNENLVIWRNFPESNDKDALLEVIRENIKNLIEK